MLVFFRWLATDEDDGKIVRELVLGGAAQHLDKTSYEIRIKTGDRFGAGTDANVHLKIFGEKGDTDKIQLKSAEHTKNKFEQGQTDKFTYEFDDFGKVCSLEIRRMNYSITISRSNIFLLDMMEKIQEQAGFSIG